MYPIKATLRSKTDPALGSVTIRFPIPWKEYDRVLEQLDPLGIGGPIDQDCQVQEIDSCCSILKRLETGMVNLDELDYLAKWLDSFDVYEALQFQAAAAAKGISSIRDFINLTFCCKRVTVVQDFRDLEEIGKDHVVNPSDKVIEQYLLKNGHLVLSTAYILYPDYMLKTMTREDLDKAVASFKCSLFDDLEISLADVFDGLLPQEGKA